jgi:hypothetical protein
MDPKANIDQQRHLATALLDTTAAGAMSQRPDIEDHVQCLCELVLVSQVPALPRSTDPAPGRRSTRRSEMRVVSPTPRRPTSARWKSR